MPSEENDGTRTFVFTPYPSQARSRL